MLSQNLTDKLIDLGMESGDFVEVFCERSQKCQISCFYTHLEDYRQGVESGVGIRILNGTHSSYAYTNDMSESNLLQLMKELKNNFSGKGQPRAPMALLRNYSARQLLQSPKTGATYAQKMALVQRALAAGKAYHSAISQMKASYLDEEQEVLIANSEGTYVYDKRPKTRLMMTAYAQNENGLQSGYVGPGAMQGFEFYDDLDVESGAAEAARIALVNLHAQHCRGGRMPVVVAGGFGGLLFHEACGHSLESRAVARGVSEFAGKLHTRVASPVLTLVDDGSLPGQWGSLGVDDEGTKTRRNVLIDKGVLSSYMVDRLGSRKMGLPTTGSARRQSYRFAPTARMTNTFIEAGTSNPQDLVSQTQQGLYVNGITGGSVDPATGAFNFAAAESYLIENGKITTPVSGATLIGNGAQVLQNVDMVANDLSLQQGYCYDESGALFIGAGQPAVRISMMTVGGVEA